MLFCEDELCVSFLENVLKREPKPTRINLSIRSRIGNRARDINLDEIIYIIDSISATKNFRVEDVPYTHAVRFKKLFFTIQ